VLRHGPLFERGTTVVAARSGLRRSRAALRGGPRDAHEILKLLVTKRRRQLRGPRPHASRLIGARRSVCRESDE